MMPILEPIRMLPKRWIGVALLCVGLQFYFTRKQIQTFPFFHYGMYSAPVWLTDTVETFAVFVNNRPMHLPPYVHDFWNKQVAFVYHQRYRIPLAVLPHRIPEQMFPLAYARVREQLLRSADANKFIAWNKQFLKPYIADYEGVVEIKRIAQTAQNWATTSQISTATCWQFTLSE